MDINLKKHLIMLGKNDLDYPERLRNMHMPPERLYCLGDISLLDRRAIAIVGSRKSSEYGRIVAQRIGAVAAENDIVVVSGLARGIDTAGHFGCLKNDGKTIAVLGTGIDIPYPRSNTELYNEIMDKGLIVSEYPPGTQASPYMFPQRNRIIAGLSEGVVVVEAGTHSGSLITAELAMINGKRVFAVPGNITSPYSLGTNKLIMDGAQAIAVVDDIFLDLGFGLKLSKEEKNQLGSDEEKVLEIIKNSGETTMDYVAEKCGLPKEIVKGIVSILEMKGIVAYSFGKIFVAKN